MGRSLRRGLGRAVEPGAVCRAPGRDVFQDQAELLMRAGVEVRVIFDGGAHRGHLTARYLRSFPEARVWAFEPAPESFRGLEVRFADESRVSLVNAALDAHEGLRELYVNSDTATNSLLPLDRDFDYADEPLRPIGQIAVPALSLDGFCASEKLERVNILKLDLQGAEREALHGASQLLATARIDAILAEILFVPVYTGQTPAWELLEQLAAFDYPLFNIYDARYSEQGQLKWGDALFLSPAVRSAARL